MGGSISVETTSGQGTAFALSVVLERLEDATPVESRPLLQFNKEAADATGRMPLPPRVLVAEDNAVNQFVVTRLLRMLGCEVSPVLDGRAAIEALAREPFDLVLMDCHLPDVDGLEATRRIRSGEAGATAQRVPIVALTAMATTESQASCLAAGMDAFLTKPVTPAALEREIARWVTDRVAAPVP
jgi:CheY-like chemotaxis protein